MTPPLRRTHLFASLAVVAALGMAACGGDDTADAVADTNPAAPSTESTTGSTAETAATNPAADDTGDATTAPADTTAGSTDAPPATDAAIDLSGVTLRVGDQGQLLELPLKL